MAIKRTSAAVLIMLVHVWLLAEGVACRSPWNSRSHELLEPALELGEKVELGEEVQKCENVTEYRDYSQACDFARKYCPSESLIPYTKIYYCAIAQRGVAARIAWQVLLFFVLLLLFRVLATTADDFFSPALMQLSQDMGLPPRFAGVTFLALGNGAPDVSSSIVAVQKGSYSMAAGALIGSGMFVGCMVGGAVILAGEGVKAKGAFLRDVCAYLITVVVVVVLLAVGTMAFWSVVLLLVFYCLYVCVVLGADLWHRANSRKWDRGTEAGQPLLSAEPPLVALSSLGEDEMLEGPSGSEDIFELNRDDLLSLTTREYSLAALAAVSQSRSVPFEASVRTYASSVCSLDTTSLPIPFVITPHWPQSFSGGPRPHFRANRAASAPTHNLSPAPSSPAPMPPRIQEVPSKGSLVTAVDILSESSTLLPAMSSAAEPQTPLEGAYSSLKMGFADEEAEQACWRTAREWGTACLSTAELPLTYARRATVPLIESEAYNRWWFIVSCALGPAFVTLYLQLWGVVPWTVAITLGVLCSTAGALATRGTSSAPQWSCGLPVPIGAAFVALIGFTIAAMWIDTLANELVGLLEFLGVLSGVPSSILGLTILAWGNSCGDLSTNVTMARRGMSNMAITACFAGPVFNTLVGLGIGFLALFKQQGVSQVSVSLPVEVIPGAVVVLANGAFLIASGWLNGGRVPARHGWVCFGMYGVYLVATLIMTAVGKTDS